MIPGVQTNPWMNRYETDPRALGNQTLGRLLRVWTLVEIDFQQVYGIDLSTPGLLESRTWRWIVARIVGLLSTEGRIQRVLNPTPEQKKAAAKHSG